MGLITDTVKQHLPAKRKTTPSGWISFNAPCCDDKRNRGGIIFNQGDAISYHCFNCQFKCSWQPGRTLSHKIRKFMKLLNMSDELVNKLAIEALKFTESENTFVKDLIPTFHERALPIEAKEFAAWHTWLTLADENISTVTPKGLIEVVNYVNSRGINPLSYPFYYSDKIGFQNRLIIPFFYERKLVGWTARSINDAKPKYLSEQQPGYVFNLDQQNLHNHAFVIVCEGPMDAIGINGCALLGAEIKDQQDWLLKRLDKEIILVPDRDHEGPKTVEQAIDFGWSISMPDWPDGIKDVNDAVVKIGKLATLWLITNAKESNSLKIKLRAKTWFKNYEKNT